jgi:uncharacterized membrane protein
MLNSDWFWTIFWSILPISELRGGIPYALANNMNPVVAYFLAVGVNILAFPIVYFFIEKLHPIFKKWTFYNNLFEKIIVRTRKKVHNEIEKYGFWGLMVFVMIPLPVTGAYTGSLASWVFEIDKKKGFLAVSLGVALAGIIVTAVYLSGAQAFHFLIKDVSHIG